MALVRLAMNSSPSVLALIQNWILDFRVILQITLIHYHPRDVRYATVRDV